MKRILRLVNIVQLEISDFFPACHCEAESISRKRTSTKSAERDTAWRRGEGPQHEHIQELKNIYQILEG